MKPRWPLLVGFLVAAVLLIGAGYALANRRGAAAPAPTGVEIVPPPATATPPPPLPTATPGPMRVYVSGAVAHPAVYALPPGSIIDDAVRAAGGFTAAADPVAINLAAPVAEGMQIYVPTQAEGAPTPPPVSAPAATIAVEGGSRLGSVTTAGLININQATVTELEMLPGIGPTMAANIVAYREANGPFAAIEAIMDVPGIGEGRFEEMKALITVGP